MISMLSFVIFFPMSSIGTNGVAQAFSLGGLDVGRSRRNSLNRHIPSRSTSTILHVATACPPSILESMENSISLSSEDLQMITIQSPASTSSKESRRLIEEGIEVALARSSIQVVPKREKERIKISEDTCKEEISSQQSEVRLSTFNSAEAGDNFSSLDSSSTVVPSNSDKNVGKKRRRKKIRSGIKVEVNAISANTASRPSAKRRKLNSNRPALSILSNRATSKQRRIRKAKSPSSSLLTREEEMKLTMSIHALRRATRIRDEMILHQKEMEEILPDYESSFGENKGDADSTPSSYAPTNVQWAEACGVSLTKLGRIMIEGEEALAQLVARNAGLVVQIAKRYHQRGGGKIINKRGTKHASKTASSSTSGGSGGSGGVTLQDMIQEGNMGLMEAAERFDPSRGFKFSTYAAWWVRQRILRSIADHSRVIRLPVHVHTMVAKIEKTRKEMTHNIGRTPSMPELAHELKMPMEKLELYTDASRNVLSLENPLYNGNGMKDDQHRTISDKVACLDVPTPEDNAELDFLRRDIQSVMDHELTPVEKNVLVERFGLEDGSPKSMEDVSNRLHLSRDRVRILEAKAINKLRHPGRNYKLKEYVEILPASATSTSDVSTESGGVSSNIVPKRVGSSRDKTANNRKRKRVQQASLPEKIWSF